MSKSPHTVLHTGNLTFLANHAVLADLAQDLVRSWGGQQLASQATVFHVGAHRLRRHSNYSGAVQIGIQTEQLYDAERRPMWKLFSTGRLSRMIQEFDLILDLSSDNAVAYEMLEPEEREKVRFGPYIFPETPPPPLPTGTGLLFFGAMNDLRRDMLCQLGQRAVRTPEGTFGPEVEIALSQAEGLLNLHFVEGRYTEYPRILKAVLAGRAVWSDPLASPLVEGIHYFSSGSLPKQDEIHRVQKSMSELLCGQYSLRSFLKREIGG